MAVTRRQLLKMMATGAAAGFIATSSTASVAAKPTIKAVAFDAFPIFDPRPIFFLAEKLFPGRGKQLSSIWRSRQFQYQWLRALSGQYQDFWHATEDGLQFAAKKMKLELSDDNRNQLMNAYLKLNAWPDVLPALKMLKSADIKIVFLSNMTERLLLENTQNAGLTKYFDHIISTDRAKTFKPDARAYQLAVDTLGLSRNEIAFAAFAGWDVAGAKWFGYPTVWINRLKFPTENLGVVADVTGKNINVLTDFVLGG